MFLPSLFAMSIFMAMDLESFNRFFDVFVWIYLVAAIAVVVSFRKRQATSDSAATPEPVVYSLKKKVNTENMSWKQKFIGTWAKIERKNFYEFMLFNGAPSFVAYAQRDSDYGNIIESKAGDENTVKISATGFPAAQGQFLPLTDKREGAPSFDSKDPAGNPVTAFLWWDEAEKLLRTEVKNPKKKMTTNMIRRVDDNDVLYLKVTNVKDEGGAECAFECTFKRTG